MKRVLIYLPILALFACGQKTETTTLAENTKVEPITEHSVVVEEEQIVWNIKGEVIDSTFKSKFKTQLTFPFSIDTNLLIRINGETVNDEDLLRKTDSTINFKELKKLRSSIIYHSSEENYKWYLDKSVEFDKMSKEEYKSYLSSIDIGQAKVSKVFSYGIQRLTDSTELLIWYIKYNTFEACPFGFGTLFFGTVLTSNHIQCSFPLAEFTGGGDPPIFSEQKIDFTLSEDLTFVQTTRTSSTDEVLGDHGDYVLKSDRKTNVLQGRITRDTVLFEIQ